MDFYPALKPMSPNDPPQGHDRGVTKAADDTVTPNMAASGMMTRASYPITEPKCQRRPAYSVRLEPGSVVTIEGLARYEWEHGIQEVFEDEVSPGEFVKRQIRVSITLRKMRLQAWEVGGLHNHHTNALKNGVADRTLK
jgi:hypothetical protein